MKKLFCILTLCTFICINIMSCASSKRTVKAQSAVTVQSDSAEPTDEAGLQK